MPVTASLLSLQRPACQSPLSQELLTLIRRFRDFGFTLDDTKALASLASSKERDCVEARDLAQSHLDEVRSKILELKALKGRLAGFIASCDETCAGRPAPECSILRDLGSTDPLRAAKSAVRAGGAKGGCRG